VLGIKIMSMWWGVDAVAVTVVTMTASLMLPANTAKKHAMPCHAMSTAGVLNNTPADCMALHVSWQCLLAAMHFYVSITIA